MHPDAVQGCCPSSFSGYEISRENSGVDEEEEVNDDGWFVHQCTERCDVGQDEDEEKGEGCFFLLH